MTPDQRAKAKERPVLRVGTACRVGLCTTVDGKLPVIRQRHAEQ